MTTTTTTPLGWHRYRPVIVFFGLAFGLSWVVWLPAAAASHGLLTWGIAPTLTGLLGAFGPTLAALLLTVRQDGLAGVRGLLRRLVRWRVAIWWYLFAFLWPPCATLFTTAIHILFGGTAPDFAHPPVLTLYPAPAETFASGPWPLLPAIFLQQLLIGSAMGEELGWRGYAQPHLQEYWTALRASLFLGVFWGLWHLPLFLTAGNALAGTNYGLFLLGIVAQAILYSWLYNNTDGSLLPVLILHAATATTGLFLTAPATSPLLAPAITWAAAIAVLLFGGPAPIRRTRPDGAAVAQGKTQVRVS